MAMMPKIDDSEEPWYEILAREEAKDKGHQDLKGAASVLETEVAKYDASRKTKETGDDRYMQQVLKSGTLSDKVAASAEIKFKFRYSAT